jgi:competence ComEA-like helix-hairpin-helix protein
MKHRLLWLILIIFCLCPVFSFAADMVDINTASLAQLDTLTGIGPAKAQAIINARPFSSVNDLLRVSGIGEKTLQKIKDQGLACVGCQPTQNSNSQLPIFNQTPNPAPAATLTPTPQPAEDGLPQAKTYASSVVFSEILPSPEGADETEEWIEIQNQNSFEVDLSGWKIEDTIGKTTSYVFPSGTKISPKGFLVLKRPETKITLNNSGDGLNLFSPDGKTKNSVSFEKAPLGQSYGKTSSGWDWSVSLTPGLPNIISGKEEKIKISPNPTPNEETFVVELPLKKEAAAASAAAVKSPKNLLPLLISIPLAIFLSALIFLLKKSLAKKP